MKDSTRKSLEERGLTDEQIEGVAQFRTDCQEAGIHFSYDQAARLYDLYADDSIGSVIGYYDVLYRESLRLMASPTAEDIVHFMEVVRPPESLPVGEETFEKLRGYFKMKGNLPTSF